MQQKKPTDTAARDFSREASLLTKLRVAAIGCGVIYASLGLVWAYGIALIALLVGALGFCLALQADRVERRQSLPPFRFQRILGTLARWIHVVAFLGSLFALVVTK